jgi:hypothetical protein
MSSARATSLALLVAVGLGGCSELYLARSDKIAASAGDAVATNKLTHMVDPWPRSSANRDIAFNGQKMQSAVERYRTNKVIPPVNATTSSTQYQQVQPVVMSTGGGGKP